MTPRTRTVTDISAYSHSASRRKQCLRLLLRKQLLTFCMRSPTLFRASMDTLRMVESVAVVWGLRGRMGLIYGPLYSLRHLFGPCADGWWPLRVAAAAGVISE